MQRVSQFNPAQQYVLPVIATHLSRLPGRQLLRKSALSFNEWLDRFSRGETAFQRFCRNRIRNQLRFRCKVLEKSKPDCAPTNSYSVTDSFTEPYEFKDQSLGEEVSYLHTLLQQLRTCESWEEKMLLLLSLPRVQELVQSTMFEDVQSEILSWPAEEAYVVLCLPAIGQAHVLTVTADVKDPKQALRNLASGLLRVETFYDSMGGIVGYQLKSLELITASIQELVRTGTDPSSVSSPFEGKNPLLNAEGMLAAELHLAPSATAVQARQPTSSSPTLTATSFLCPRSQAMPAQLVETKYHVPKSVDLAGENGREIAQRATTAGLEAMPFLGELYPVGGAGDRLGLTCEVTGESLPTAMLPYCGRSLMEGLIRDLQAREYLYWQLTGQQLSTPVSIMTSDAKGNHRRITQLMEENNWFGRGRDSFRLFRQPLVPVLCSDDGRWLLKAPLRLMSKPGGHGAIWKLMWDEGVFDWLSSKGVEALLVRQISNPLAGTDTTLLSLAGVGQSGGHAFGFMSCERAVGAAEGMNVLQERKVWVEEEECSTAENWNGIGHVGQNGYNGNGNGKGSGAAVRPSGRWLYQYGVTNVEYTEFEKLGISDEAVEGSTHSVFPANTNVLYVGLAAVRNVVRRAVAAGSGEGLLPGLIFNLKKKVEYTDPLTGVTRKVQAGRMESTMQNLADQLVDALPAPLSCVKAPPPLSTFMVYNLRRKVTSSAKKQRTPGSRRIHQTPDGSFFDLQRNAWHILQMCGMKHVPEVGSVEDYLQRGPGFVFLYHPALGPLWDVIAQKIRGGSLAAGSELVLEVAEARLNEVHVSGSLLVHAAAVLGHHEVPLEVCGLHATTLMSSKVEAPQTCLDGGAKGGEDVVASRLRYSSRCGRVHLNNVTIENRGINWSHHGNVYWKHQVARHESARIILRGQSEFEAHDVTITGDRVFDVPDGYRMVVTADDHGGAQETLVALDSSSPSWEWMYTLEPHGAVSVRFKRNSLIEIMRPGLRKSSYADQWGDFVLDFVI